MRTINPTTGVADIEIEPHSELEVEERLAKADAAFSVMRETTFAQRAEWLLNASRMLIEQREQLAQMITIEMGKPITQAVAEVEKCAKSMAFYAAHTERFLADTPLTSPSDVGASQAWTRYEPLGIVLAVMPWNYPLWQVMRFAAPALMAGNVGLLKHASNVPQSALFLDSLFVQAGFPDGAFQCLLIGGSEVEGVIRDKRVKAVTLTGSEPAGRSVASAAGDSIKKSVLELGGSDPFIVMPSADIDLAAKTGVKARVNNNGQSCIAGKRFIIHADVYDEFVSAFTRGMSELVVGDPLDEATEVGPLATQGGRDDVAELVDDARLKGADILLGGIVPDGPGYFYPPTVIAGITPDMRVEQEELFGPVAIVYRASSAEHALELANQTSFGLSSSVWTQSEEEQEWFMRRLDAGAVFINGMTISFSELPFGGVKNSGFGRELADVGIKEFCNLKTIWKA